MKAMRTLWASLRDLWWMYLLFLGLIALLWISGCKTITGAMHGLGQDLNWTSERMDEWELTQRQ